MYFLVLLLFGISCVIKKGENRCKIVNNDGSNFFYIFLCAPTRSVLIMCFPMAL